MTQTFLNLVHAKASQKIPFLPHAVRQMSRPDRMISTSDIRKVIFEGEIIEDYPGDARGHSCLMLGKVNSGRAIHLVCVPKDDYIAIITAYIPGKEQWMDDFKTRRNR